MYRNEKLSVITDELNELGMPRMSAKLQEIVKTPEFTKTDSLSLFMEIIEAEYSERSTRRLQTHIKSAHLSTFTGGIEDCTDSVKRTYKPNSIVSTLSDLDFVKNGLNICILGPSDAGKTYLAKSLGILACAEYRVEYTHCETVIEELAVLKRQDFTKYKKKMNHYYRLDLLILDDFLLHSIDNEDEVKVLQDLLETRSELSRSVIVCSQREPSSWTAMIRNDEVAANAIYKRATKHYTVVIEINPEQ